MNDVNVRALLDRISRMAADGVKAIEISKNLRNAGFVDTTCLAVFSALKSVYTTLAEEVGDATTTGSRPS